MKRLQHQSVVSLALPVLFAACGGSTSSTVDATSAALSATSTAGDTTTLTNCLTTDAQCDRDATDDRTCDDALRACLGRGDHDGDGGACDHDHDGDGGAEGHHGRHRGGGHDHARHGGGPGGCLDALEACAKGTDTIDSCVATAVACLQAAAPPKK